MAKTLKMTREQIFSSMDADEFYKWMAFEMLMDTEYRDKLKTHINKEESAKLDDEERSKAIKDMFNKIIGI